MKTVSARQANHEFSDLLSRVERSGGSIDWGFRVRNAAIRP
jgi:hypothetical protein